MRIPDRLKIGALWWEVKVVPLADLDCDSTTVGDQSVASQTIRLAAEISPEMRDLTFFHEILHCIDGEMSHSTVEMLSQALYQVFRENDLLAKDQ